MASPVATNWSTMPCALLAKSPNCASHSTSAAGPESTLNPYSNPITACSESGELHTRNLSWSPRPMLSIGLTGLDVLEQYSTECLWLKVPRSTSWPLSRTWQCLRGGAAGSSPGYRCST